jgi:hypothetical protein
MAPIVIGAATGERPLIARPVDNIDSQNNIEIVNSSFLIVRGLPLQGGSTEVGFIGGHHITVEDTEVYETGNNSISLNYGNTHAFVFRCNHIHRTELSTSGPPKAGLLRGLQLRHMPDDQQPVRGELQPPPARHERRRQRRDRNQGRLVQ